jgi:Sulfotransferase family
LSKNGIILGLESPAARQNTLANDSFRDDHRVVTFSPRRHTATAGRQLPHAMQAVLDCYPDLRPDLIERRLRYCTFVNVSKRYMYFDVQKAASTAMKELLNHIENAPSIKCFIGDDRASRRDMYIHTRPNVVLPSLLDLDDDTQREVLESADFLRMTVVRNPYTRLIAAWQNKVLVCEPGYEHIYQEIKGHSPEMGKKSLVSFEEFVEYVARKCDLRTGDVHWRRQVDHTLFRAINYSTVGKVENMTAVLETLQKHLELAQPLVAKEKNVSAHSRPVQIGEELADKIYGLYKEDFETFQYERNSVPIGQPETTPTVPEEKYIDEIIERNLILVHLYDQQAELRKVERLHLLAIANSITSLLDAMRKGWCRRRLTGLVLTGETRRHARSSHGTVAMERSSARSLGSPEHDPLLSVGVEGDSSSQQSRDQRQGSKIRYHLKRSLTALRGAHEFRRARSRFDKWHKT